MTDTHGKQHRCRTLLDNASQANFITESFAQLLNLPRKQIHMPVSGINGLTTHIKHMVTTTMTSLHTRFDCNFSFLVTPQISEYLPSERVDPRLLNIPTNLPLADPEFYIPAPIDILLGAEIYYWLLCPERIVLSDHRALAQKSSLGWLISGRVTTENIQRPLCHFTQQTLQDQLVKFWEIEEMPDSLPTSTTESLCIDHYYANVQRTESGRYMVKLPFNDKRPKLGDSYKTALRRFYTLERKLTTNPELKAQYSEFLQEYLQLGHMKEVNCTSDQESYYLPHHAVMKESSLTTKIRVVFDGSAKTTSGISLNDALLTGPTIQEDLISIIIRFRTHQYVLMADIEKMYRQVLVHPDHTKYQRILWREDPSKELKTYELLSVTYGLAAAPYLAIQTLHQLAEDEKEEYPLAAHILKRDFYVDDLLTGTETHQEAEMLRDQLVALLQRGGFQLRKWISNDVSLTSNLSEISTSTHVTLDSHDVIKALGIHWNPQLDILSYTINCQWEKQRATKRNILSFISKLFDPLGLLGPVIIQAKIIMQQLWLLKINWDSTIPKELEKVWLNYSNHLSAITSISIPRRIIMKNYSSIELHGFCDASEKAYGACLYLRSASTDTTESVLICAKSRVAPLKTISLPRLELCAALLLARLLKNTRKALNLNITRIQLWSDSTITLQWINTAPHTLKTFVANRISEIQSLTTTADWRHVPSPDNPADLISRGLTAQELKNNDSWFHGPNWLQESEDSWPTTELPLANVPEQRSTIPVFTTLIDFSFLSRYSSMTRLIRVTAFCLRFVNGARKQRRTGPLTTDELQTAHTRIIKLTQQETFGKEFRNLSLGKPVDKDSKLLSLNPFMDTEGIIRVGGRLSNATIPYEARHPIILPKNHHVTCLIIRQQHLNHYHGGTQTTLYAVRQRYWPIDGKNTTRHIIHKCITCFKNRPPAANHLMGNLPKSRLEQTRPFLNSGIDFCGPFFIKEKQHRNRGKLKVYVAVFVCFVTKAVHLELATDLSTEAFISCLRRFIARRGKCQNLYSDNGTNFVGANNELKELHDLIKSETHNNQVSDFLSDKHIRWHFTPPRSPHFGGLWEASVKSFKGHFRRVVKDTLLTYEQLYTFATEIEAILNSRPLTPLSSDPNDLLALTPGHFLIGDTLLSIPDQNYNNTPTNRLSVWQQLQKMKQHFWSRWHKEYLNELNCRSKWRIPTTNIEPGTMVIIRDDNVHPMHWPLGRVIAVHPGADKVNRVITVKTNSGTYTRSVKRVSPLPLDEIKDNSIRF